MAMLQIQALPMCCDESKEDSSDLKIPDPKRNFEAYFSERPPPVPVRIAFIGQPRRHQVHPERVQRLLQTMKEIEMYSKKNSNENFELAEMTAYGQNYSALIKRSISQSEQLSPSILSASAAKPCRPKHASSKHLVRLLLSDMLSKLPLPLKATATSHGRCCRSRLPTKVKSVSFSPVESLEIHVCRRKSSPIKQNHHCNTATQAKAETLPSATDCSLRSGRSTQAVSEDWIGGVRALRDSHVKLVLRELRHIDRLNRTLDRATQNRPC